jgi:nitrite reductase/ring-hydroxylating ferredoxin subunit
MKTIECINVAREAGHAVLSLDGAEYSVSLDDLSKVLKDIAGTCPAPSMELLRPSLLPKLAQCPCFVSSPDAGEAAERGTRMDTAFRDLLMGVDEFRACEHLEADEKDAVLWAVQTVRMLCSGEEVVVDKKRCSFPQWHPRVTGGEADCICPMLGKLFDLKSGQIRNYWEQQASYAKSIMEREFLDEVTCHLLFCDQRQIVTHKFTYQEAIDIVNGVVDSVDRGDGPRLCEYCGWCAAQDTCPLRNKAAQEALTLAASGTLEESFAAISQDPAKLADFITKAGILESYVEKGKKKILEYLTDKKEVPGFTRVSCKGKTTVSPEDVAKYATWIGVPKLLKAYGSLSAATFRKLFTEALPEQQFPEELVKTGAGYSYVKQTPVPKIKTNK